MNLFVRGVVMHTTGIMISEALVKVKEVFTKENEERMSAIHRIAELDAQIELNSAGLILAEDRILMAKRVVRQAKKDVHEAEYHLKRLKSIRRHAYRDVNKWKKEFSSRVKGRRYSRLSAIGFGMKLAKRWLKQVMCDND